MTIDQGIAELIGDVEFDPAALREKYREERDRRLRPEGNDDNEGRLGNPNGFFAGSYGAGPIRFFQLMEDWRATGDLPGVELR